MKNGESFMTQVISDWFLADGILKDLKQKACAVGDPSSFENLESGKIEPNCEVVNVVEGG